MSFAQTLDNLPLEKSPALQRFYAANQGRDFTILGPWDSKPEESVYSYQSEFAQRILGSKPGERVSISEAEGAVEILSISPWTA